MSDGGAYDDSWNGETTNFSVKPKKDNKSTLQKSEDLSKSLSGKNGRKGSDERQKQRRQRAAQRRTRQAQRKRERDESAQRRAYSQRQRGAQMTVQQKKKDTMDMLDRSIGIITHTEEVGRDTAQRVDEQSAQLKTIYNDLNEIEDLQKKADDSMARQNGITGYFYSFFSRPTTEAKPTLEQKIAETSNSTDTNERKPARSRKPIKYNPNDDAETRKAKQLLAAVRRVRQNAEDVGEEMDRQHRMLDEIDTKMDSTGLKMKQQKDKVTSLAKHGYY